MDEPKPPPPPPPKKRGCFFYGCLGSLVLFALIGFAIFRGVHYFAHRVGGFVEDFTDTKPLVLPRAEGSAPEMEQVQKRLGAFVDSLNSQTNAPTLVLTGDDLNNLIAGASESQGFQGQVHLTIEGGQIKGQVSVPLDAAQIPLLDLKGRFLNGSMSLHLGLTNGQLWAGIDSFEANGKPLPKEFLQMMQMRNLAEDFQDDPTNASVISRLQTIEVKDGKITLIPKKPQ